MWQPACVGGKGKRNGRRWVGGWRGARNGVCHPGKMSWKGEAVGDNDVKWKTFCGNEVKREKTAWVDEKRWGLCGR